MTLLNASALFASLGLLVPIVIHLHRKRKAKVIEWPAMQFLTNTLASRRRGLSLENLLLLFVRCLVILLFALAMAQPLLPSGGSLPLVASLVMMTGGLVGLAVGVIRSFTLRARVAGIVAAVVLLAGAAATFKLDPEDFTSPTENCDLVIVLDETSSMLMAAQTAEGQQQSPFADSVDQALMLVDQLSGSSTVSIIRWGPVIETIDGSPFRDLPAARKLLVELQPTGGGANTNGAIDQAVELAKKGPNSRKQVVLFTDDQLRTWESFEESAKLHPPSGRVGGELSESPGRATAPEILVQSNDADALPASSSLLRDPPRGRVKLQGSQDESRVHLAVHLAKLPQRPANVSIVSLRVESPVPAGGQPLLIEADVRNHGAAAVGNADLQLSVDGKPVTVETIDVLSPATTTTIRFPYTFQMAGEQVVSVQTEFPDAMMDDNRHDTVVSVVPFVSVLLVNGNSFAKPGDQSATFLQLALDPISRTAVDQQEAVTGHPIRVQPVNVTELSEQDSLSDYDVIVLSEVPQLPDEAAARIASYVRDGGGLWVIPDQQVNATFYNDWKTVDEESPLLPATLMEHQQVAKPDADGNAGRTGIDLQTIASSFVSDLIKTGEHDLTEVVVSGYRQAALNDSAVAALQLTNGDPLFVEHPVGQGRVLLQTVALGRQESNLPQRVCFPVLMHLWSYDLADCQRDGSNFEPTPELSVPVSLDELADDDVDSLLLVDPTGEEQTVTVVHREPSNLAQISPAGRPGVYTLSSQKTPGTSQSFTIARDERESDLAVISGEKLNALQSAHDIQWLENAEQLRIAGVAELAEYEIAPYLLLAVLCLIAAESLLAAWVRSRRAVTASAQPAKGGRGWTEPAKEAPGFRSFLAPTPTTRKPDAETPTALVAGGAE